MTPPSCKYPDGGGGGLGRGGVAEEAADEASAEAVTGVEADVLVAAVQACI